MHQPKWRQLASEAIGTALLLLGGLSAVIFMFGTGSPMARVLPDVVARQAITGFLFGCTGASIALSFVGRESGAHINPAVTFGFWLMQKMDAKTAAGYVAAQLAGAVLGSLPLLAWGAMGRSVSFGATVPGAGYSTRAVLMGEAITTFALICVLCIFIGFRSLRRFTPATMPLLYGVMVPLEAAISGTSTNPARTFGPALISGQWQGWWIYWVGPILGTLAGILACSSLARRIEVAKLYHFESHRRPILHRGGGGPHAVLVLVAAAGLTLGSVRTPAAPLELWRQVEVIRTAHGVPHIRAENLRAGGYALAWVMSEDYGTRTGLRLLSARGELSRVAGRATVDTDFENLLARKRAVQTYHLLEQQTRDIYDGFAAGANRYIELHRATFPAGMPADFTGYDVASMHIGEGPPAAKVRRLIAALGGQAPPGDQGEDRREDDGSNAWALAPSRTKSGHAILLRNPHLAWNAGYYEAHLTVPGVVDFYGDFRVGGPLIVIGGFNRDLGWATTNSNSGDLTEFYALDRDPEDPDRYLLDGASLPLERESLTVTYKDGESVKPETREFAFTPMGRVVYMTKDKAIIARTAGEGEFRAGEQFLRMMRAKSLAQWTDAMRMRALVTSNYTYADRAGNIFNLWNASLPLLPHPSGGDTKATPAREMRDLWTEYIPFAALPQLRNPRGGYVHNENDSPHFANVRGRINLANAYANIEPPLLHLRSQHAIQLIGGSNRLALEDVIRLKHSYRMLLADRVKPDLIAAVRATKPSGDIARAISLLGRWNNTAGPASRGAMLFEIWAQRYMQNHQPAEIFAHPWSQEDPLRTPRGLVDRTRAAEAFAWAVDETVRRHGRWDVAWGEVHRVRRGSVDVPVGGCSGAMGCFRVLTFASESDGKLAANGGDGWVLAVEFGAIPRAYSVLAYGESQDPASPWYADQAAMFAEGRLKRVAFTAGAVDAAAVHRYRPGEP